MTCNSIRPSQAGKPLQVWFPPGADGYAPASRAQLFVSCSAACQKAACGVAGNYVAVERLEGTCKGVSLVQMVWVFGISYESTLVAVVVPQMLP